jgi:hypothetical protein
VFPSTIDGTTTDVEELTLNAGTGTIVLSGAIGSTIPLGDFTIASASTLANAIEFGSNISAKSFSITTASPVTLTGASIINTSSGNGPIFFPSTIDGAFALTLTPGSGLVTFSANIGDTTPLGALTISAGSSGLTIGSSVTDIAAASFATLGSVPTTLNGAALTIDTSASNGAIAFGGAVNGASNLTLSPGSGSVTFSSAIGNTTPLSAILIDNATNVTASSSIAAASFTQTAGTGTTLFSGALSTTGDISVTTNIVTLNAPVLTANNVTIVNAGLLTISSAGFMNLDGYFLQSGAGVVHTAGNIVTANQPITFTRAVTLTGNVNLNTNGTAPGDITFGNKIDGPYNLVLNADQISFGGAVGTTPLSSIQATATGTITTAGNHTVASGPMIYNGSVILTEDIQFYDAGLQPMTFSSSITGNFNLTLLAPSTQITVGGDVDLSGSSGSIGRNLSATSSAGLTFNGQILSQGGNASPGVGGGGGNIVLSASAGSISVHNIDASGGDGTVAGGNGGTIDLQPASNYSSGFPVGIIVINNDLSGNGNLVTTPGTGGVGIGGTVTLSANRAGPATVATITSSAAGNDISVLAREFSMGSYEAMTGLGNIVLTCTNMTLGDMVALDNLLIFGVDINLLTHGDITILNKYGDPYTSPSLHFLGGTGYIQSGALHPTGPLNAQNLGLSPSVFRPQLILGDPVILNYDTSPQPPPPVPPAPFVASEASKRFAIYQLMIADAQLSDMLPIYRSSFPAPYQLVDSEYCSPGNRSGCPRRTLRAY